MNNLNERFNRTIQPNDLVVIMHTPTNEQIEVYPGFFVNASCTKVEFTNGGRIFFRELKNDYLNGEIPCKDVISILYEISDWFSGYEDLVIDKLCAYFYK